MEAENNLKSLTEGVKKINSEISVVLTGLVEEERGECRAYGELRHRRWGVDYFCLQINKEKVAFKAVDINKNFIFLKK